MNATFLFDAMSQKRSCLQICDLWFEWCCCGCCIEKQYAEHFHLGLLGDNNSNGQTNQTASTPISAGNTTIVISSAPDLGYLEEVNAAHSASSPKPQTT